MERKLYRRRRIKLLCTVGCITVAIIHNLSIKNMLSLNFQLKVVIYLCAANNCVYLYFFPLSNGNLYLFCVSVINARLCWQLSENQLKLKGYWLVLKM